MGNSVLALKISRLHFWFPNSKMFKLSHCLNPINYTVCLRLCLLLIKFNISSIEYELCVFVCVCVLNYFRLPNFFRVVKFHFIINKSAGRESPLFFIPYDIFFFRFFCVKGTVIFLSFVHSTVLFSFSISYVYNKCEILNTTQLVFAKPWIK